MLQREIIAEKYAKRTNPTWREVVLKVLERQVKRVGVPQRNAWPQCVNRRPAYYRWRSGVY
jgi:hypothetical protein